MSVDTNELWNIARKNGCKTKISIAEKLNISRDTVGKVMEGKEKPSAMFIERFVTRFNVPPAKAGRIFFG